MQSRIIIPKNINRCNIELYLDMNWDPKVANEKLATWRQEAKAFASTIQTNPGNVPFEINYMNVACGSYDDIGSRDQIVILISIINHGDQDQFKDTMKKYMNILIPAFNCTDAMFNIVPSVPTYIYDNCK